MYSSMYWPFRFGSTGSDDPPSSELLDGVVVSGVVLEASGEKLYAKACVSPPNARMLMSCGMFS
jgi:hypothetical protein